MEHVCTLQPSDALILNNTDYAYIGCRDSSGNENLTSSSGPLEVSILKVEVQGEDAIQAGIETSAIWPTTVYTNQQVYLRNSNNDQLLGTFDKVALYSTTSQRWAFNYITSVELFINGLFNITPIFYTAEYSEMTFQQINNSVNC